MFNRLILDSDTLHNCNKRRDLRRKLAKQMILDTNFRKIERFLLRLLFICVFAYGIQHYITYGHFLHFHVHG